MKEQLEYKILQKPCCFLDRDGVINFDKGYTHKIKDFIFRPYVKKAIKYFGAINLEELLEMIYEEKLNLPTNF